MAIKDITLEERRLIGKVLIAAKRFWNAKTPDEETRALEALFDSVGEAAEELEKAK